MTTLDPATENFELRPVRDDGRLWAVVLAGGEGIRLRPLVRRLFGEDRPKQFARLLGPRSLLGATLDRVELGIAREQTLVVTTRRHASFVEEEFRGRPRPIILEQPDDRGTAAAVLFPAARIAQQDPEALVAVFPSDHFIPDGARFMSHVLGVADLVQRDSSRIVLVGAPATRPEPEYGWIRPGSPLGAVDGEPVCAVQAFREKPEPARACHYFARGYLWNTLVFVASARLLLDLGRRHAPDLARRLERVADFAGGPLERWAVRQAYLHAPRVNFSRAILGACLDRLAVSRLPQLSWSDWGTPERVLESLRSAGLAPDWLAGLRPGGAPADAAPPGAALTRGGATAAAPQLATSP
jgi:mannose-1-phosphate guanylyltransferase